MMRFLTDHAFKDISIVPPMNGHIYHVCPMRATIAQCSLSRHMRPNNYLSYFLKAFMFSRSYDYICALSSGLIVVT